MAFPATQSIWIHTLELALAASLSRMPTKLLEMKIYNVSLPGRIARLPWPALNKHHRRPEMRKVLHSKMTLTLIKVDVELIDY